MTHKKVLRALCFVMSVVQLCGSLSCAASAANDTAVKGKTPSVALTFDDGPSAANTARILDILEVNGAKATFFVIGSLLAENADTARRAARMGCEIGNHTYDHKTWTALRPDDICMQIAKADAVIEQTLGTKCTLVRTPGGHCCGQSNLAARPIILWSVDTEDWKYALLKNGNTEAYRDQVIRNATEHVQDGDIILMHDIYDFTAQCCETIIPRLCAQGFRLVTVSELMRLHGIKMQSGDVYRSAR